MIYGRDRDQTPEEVIRDLREIVENLQEDNERLHAELAKFFECDESDMERMTEAEWHCTRKVYHKEGE